MNSRTKRKWYVQGASDFRNSPSKLMCFTSSRGADADTGATIPAYYDLQAPSGPRGFTASVGADWSTWAQRRPFDSRVNPTVAPTPADWGFVDCRYINQRAVSAFCDGHAEALGIDAYYDMQMCLPGPPRPLGAGTPPPARRSCSEPERTMMKGSLLGERPFFVGVPMDKKPAAKPAPADSHRKLITIIVSSVVLVARQDGSSTPCKAAAPGVAQPAEALQGRLAAIKSALKDPAYADISVTPSPT